ncbi:hypothetical protein KAK06_19050 [Ideonella sp. 4Y11]|uniref:Uncharacterized protein n=1 Tax=Ideonella aquatica TaxID=2824119 RepID=A0A941BHM4_9BURK|nr:hypothetical protein [Ideonella aquatica]MBQ0961061.1 hypothetical protein [Ideonella aquatica]
MATAPVPRKIAKVTPEALARNPHLRLGDPEVRPTMDAIRERIQSDPAFGRELLRKAGIVDGNGKLTKNFGG